LDGWLIVAADLEAAGKRFGAGNGLPRGRWLRRHL